MSRIVNVYIVYNLDVWPRSPTNNVKVENCLFGASNVVKNSDKEIHVYSGCGTTFDSAGSWSFDNAFARNGVIFGVSNSLLSHADDRKNNFLVLGENPIVGINGTFGLPAKNFIINFSKGNTKFSLSCW